jgi:2-keto-4-pentenoate hydratase/2-oxohepta-3-ene-1,7-dioic acid hydratase in catechol pathway
MKLATFTQGGVTRIGVVDGGAVVDLAAAASELPRDMIGFLQLGSSALEAARAAASRPGHRLPLADVRLEAPVRPGKYLAIGLNYADHIAETGRDKPAVPSFFNKQTTCVIGPADAIWMPHVSEQLDYEGELAFVIGRRCRYVPKARASEVIAGYLIGNDVSVRDFQRRTPTVTLGKSFDTHGPLGPWIVTPDEVGDPHALELRTWVNGELRQHSSTKQLITDCFEMVEMLSTVCTLEPGDVVATGTPSGVALGMRPPKWLKVGDVVRIEIERVGVLENRVVEEPPGTAHID